MCNVDKLRNAINPMKNMTPVRESRFDIIGDWQHARRCEKQIATATRRIDDLGSCRGSLSLGNDLCCEPFPCEEGSDSAELSHLHGRAKFTTGTPIKMGVSRVDMRQRQPT
jgi:hypothetical protein